MPSWLPSCSRRASSSAGIEPAVRQRDLGAAVFAPAALEDQLDGQVIALDLLEVDRREGLVAQVVAAVLAAERVDGIRAEVGLLRRNGYRLTDLFAQPARAPSGRVPHVEERRSGVLADRAGLLPRQRHVLQDRIERTGRPPARAAPPARPRR